MIGGIMRISLVLSLVGLVSCGDGIVGGPAGGSAAANEVRVGNFFFNPSTRSVSVGATVTWTWNAGSALHNVTFSDGPASPTQASGSYQRTFAASGVYSYVCTLHSAAMSGTVTVP